MKGMGKGKMRNFNYWLFLVVIIVYAFLGYYSFLAFMAADEGTLGNSIIDLVLSKIFYFFFLFAIPLSWSSSAALHYIGIGVVLLVYAYLTERCITLLKNRIMFLKSNGGRDKK
jgi:hypothetical protein